jgi:MalT-like TPR region
VLLGESLFAYASAARPEECAPLFAEAIACTERTGDLFTRLTAHNNAGFIALTVGDIPAARAHLEAAVRAAETIRFPHLIALGNLAEVRRAEHDLDGARSGFQDVVRMARRTGDKYALAGAILGLACLAADLGDWHRAAVLYGAEHALADQIESVAMSSITPRPAGGALATSAVPGLPSPPLVAPKSCSPDRLCRPVRWAGT